MERENHTPGPWEVAEYPDGSIVVYSKATDDYEIARILGNEVELAPEEVASARTDARLIAAAPDLLEAAQLALRSLAPEGHPAYILGTEPLLRAAIAKATGQS